MNFKIFEDSALFLSFSVSVMHMLSDPPLFSCHIWVYHIQYNLLHILER